MRDHILAIILSMLVAAAPAGQDLLDRLDAAEDRDDVRTIVEALQTAAEADPMICERLAEELHSQRQLVRSGVIALFSGAESVCGQRLVETLERLARRGSEPYLLYLAVESTDLTGRRGFTRNVLQYGKPNAAAGIVCTIEREKLSELAGEIADAFRSRADKDELARICGGDLAIPLGEVYAAALVTVRGESNRENVDAVLPEVLSWLESRAPADDELVRAVRQVLTDTVGPVSEGHQ